MPLWSGPRGPVQPGTQSKAVISTSARELSGITTNTYVKVNRRESQHTIRGMRFSFVLRMRLSERVIENAGGKTRPFFGKHNANLSDPLRLRRGHLRPLASLDRASRCVDSNSCGRSDKRHKAQERQAAEGIRICVYPTFTVCSALTTEPAPSHSMPRCGPRGLTSQLKVGRCVRT